MPTDQHLLACKSGLEIGYLGPNPVGDGSTPHHLGITEIVGPDTSQPLGLLLLPALPLGALGRLLGLLGGLGGSLLF